MKKILLIHGWNYANYNPTKCLDAWQNRQVFVDELKKHFEVIKINLPGFCGNNDPLKPWHLDDYVAFVDSIIKIQKPDIILGYSFGGAIALRWKFLSNNHDIATVLVSPAILRNYKNMELSNKHEIIKRILPRSLVHYLRNIYLSVIKENLYYSKASRIMRETYRNIVTVDLRKELLSLLQPITLIYGENDTATPPSLINQTLSESHVKHDLEIISDGGHDIANSHTAKLVEIILKHQ